MRRRFQKRIYIPLPDERARKSMFRLHFGDKGHCLQEEDFQWLAERTEGFSGSDINVFCRQCLHYPIRLLQKCHYFKKDVCGMWRMSTEEEGRNVDVKDLPRGKVVIPDVNRVSEVRGNDH